MALKKRKLEASPARVRAVLLRTFVNWQTRKPISNDFIYEIVRIHCLHETDDDRWQWLVTASQEHLLEEMPPSREMLTEDLEGDPDLRVVEHIPVR